MTAIEPRAMRAVVPDSDDELLALDLYGPPAVAHQISALRHLPDGWRNGDGLAFDAGYLGWLADALARLYPPHAPAPTICPTTYGVVSLEWSLPGGEVSLEINPETRQGELVWAVAHPPNSGEVVIGDMAKRASWLRLAECLAQFTGDGK